MPVWVRRLGIVVVFWSYVWLLGSFAVPLLHTARPEEPQQIDAQQNEQADQFVDPLGGFVGWFAGDAIKVYTLILTGATILLWRSTDKLWKAGERQAKLTRKSLRLTRDQFTADQRPWLSLELISAEQNFVGNLGQAKIQLRAFNSGRTPAIGVRFESRLIRAVPTADDAFGPFVSSKISGYGQAQSGDDPILKRTGIVFPNRDAVIGPMEQTEEDVPPDIPFPVPHYHLFCCLLYRGTGSKTVHHTAAVYHLNFNVIGTMTSFAPSYAVGHEIISFNLMGINSAT